MRNWIIIYENKDKRLKMSMQHNSVGICANDKALEFIPSNSKLIDVIFHDIPPITNELGKYWKQPKVEDIKILGKYAFITENGFNELSEYSSTIPTGVYEGKMWKAKTSNGYELRWFENIDEKSCSIKRKEILIRPEYFIKHERKNRSN